jgi:formylglycine-generating enzyme required for sulfatase activity
VLLIVAVSSCKKESVQGVNIEKKIDIWVGETATLTPTFIPDNAHNKKVRWESSDTNVATVVNGKVTGITVGITSIKVITQDGGRTASCWVSVIQPIEPEEMIWVEGGTFTMGCKDDECFNNELPIHEVTLSGFYISKYVVTQKEWMAAMGNGGHPDYAIGDDKPAWTMSWKEIQEYINRLKAHTGKNYRLPTEAEWEYAARGGNKSKGYKYSGSNNIDEVAWYDGNYSSIDLLHPVGQKKPNELGIYDMSGNMWECCSDFWGKYPDEPQTNPTGPNTGEYRVMRGGAFGAGAFICRSAYRHGMNTDCAGFRLALSAEQKKD